MGSALARGLAAFATTFALAACGPLLALDELERVACVEGCAEAPSRDDGGLPAAIEPDATTGLLGGGGPTSRDAAPEASSPLELPPLPGDAGADAALDAAPPITPVVSHLYPAVPRAAYPRAVRITLAAEASSRIRYSTNGASPTQSAPSPFTLLVDQPSTPLRWLADNGALEALHSETVLLDSALQRTYGVLAEQATLGTGGSPIATARPGANVALRATVQFWSDPSCPGCILQVVYGFGTQALGCLANDIPGPWPGLSGVATQALTAPAAPGAYPVRIGFATQYTCADAVRENPIRAGGQEIGLLLVR